MRKRLVLILAYCFIIMATTPAPSFAQDVAPVIVTGQWVRPTAQSATGMDDHAPASDSVSAVYLTLENQSSSIYRLLGATSPVAEIVEIHETRMVGDMMRMRPMEGGIEIPYGEQVALEPGGYHIMLMNLAGDLVPGAAITLTLLFDRPLDDGAPPGETWEMVIGVPVLAEAPPQSDFVAEGVWARPTVADQEMGNAESTPDPGHGHQMGQEDAVSAVYMLLRNRGEHNDQLTGVSSDAAAVAEIHETRMDGDMMRMRPVEGGIEITAGGTIALQPGGYHIMLMELARPLVPGDAILLALTFESGAELLLAAPVYDPQMPDRP